MTDKTLKEKHKNEPDLYKRSIKGGYWVFASNILELGKTLLIANLFYLEDLGLLSISYMLMSLLRQFSESGFQNALIQKKDQLTRRHLDTTWVIGILRGLLLFGIIFSIAPLFVVLIDKSPLATVSAEKIPLATGVIRVIGLCFLIGGFQNIGTIFFQKELNFRKIFYLSMVGTICDFVLTVILVLVLRSIWGVIISRVVAALVNCVFTYMLSSYRPHFRFHLREAKELWRFGKWIYGQQILGYLLSEGDDFFVVFGLGLAPLALYRHAYRFAMMPTTHISYVISRVTFPAYAKIQDDLPRLREGFLKVLTITALLSMPAVSLIFFLGPDFVHLFLPERMYPMIPVLQILAFKGLMGSLSATWPPLLRAIGKPEKMTHLMILGLLILGITIYPLSMKWGITGTAVATLLVGIGVSPYGYYLLCKTLRCNIAVLAKPCFLPLTASIVMCGWLFLLKRFLITEATYVTFMVYALTSLSIYLVSLYILDRLFNHGLRSIYQEQWGHLRSMLRK